MILLAVAGDPVAHSLSPAMQEAALRAAGLAGRYLALRVERGRLAARAAELEREGFLGLNVTMPLKEEALALARRASRRALEAGAANTLVRRPEGGWAAENTDVEAVAGALREAGWRPGPAVVLGAGGAAAAAAVALGELGAPSVLFLNRSRERAGRLARRMSVHFPGTRWSAGCWPAGPGGLEEAGWPEGATLLVQAAPLAMEGSGAPYPLPPEALVAALAPGARVLELVYRPPRTPLLEAAAARGLGTVDGLELLLRQGAASFELWTGRGAPRAAMREALEEVLRCSAG
ncbi:MAG: shikimate dehydrogenase [Bacillota bacterium]|nr:shikimate dehydrogenase [Bacillota bacterium]